MNGLELSRPIKVRPLPGRTVIVDADEAERAALARRFGLSDINHLRADIELEEKGKAIRAVGHLDAEIVQACAVSAEDFSVTVGETVELRFVPEGSLAPSESDDEEIELEADDCDEIEYSGESFDLGEAVAQTLGLAIDPYAEGPKAAAARKAAGIVEEGHQDGPLAAGLAALRKN